VKAVRNKLIENGVEMVNLGSEKADDGVVERTGAREGRSGVCIVGIRMGT
jgi:hypothetical protein